MKMPSHWAAFLDVHALIGCDIEIPESEDLSALGADFQIMNEAQCYSEAVEAYPGIIAVYGYYPVGMCLEGSGDYYYIQSADGQESALYRIYHDAVRGKQLVSGGVVPVLERYQSILNFL